MADERLYGVLAEFETPEALVEAARSRRAREGYRDLDAFTPFPVEELTTVLRLRDPARAVARIVRRLLRRGARARNAVLHQLGLPDQCRRPAALSPGRPSRW